MENLPIFCTKYSVFTLPLFIFRYTSSITNGETRKIRLGTKYTVCERVEQCLDGKQNSLSSDALLHKGEFSGPLLAALKSLVCLFLRVFNENIV